MKFKLFFVLSLLLTDASSALIEDYSSAEAFQNVPPVVFNDSDVVIDRDVNFFLFTNVDPGNAQHLPFNDTVVLDRSDFNDRVPTTVVAHGWKSSRHSPSCTLVRDGFLHHANYNVILVDWSRIADRDYVTAATKVRIVARYVALMIDFLVDQGTSRDNMTLVGHSLGAHVAGLAGRFSVRPISHVVGLDPAMPGFQLRGSGKRISATDASLVEAIHTTAGTLGFITSVGHLDFYPNGGGPSQPGCGVNLVCSHGRSYEYYAESLRRPDNWYGIKCDNHVQFMAGNCKNNPVVYLPRWYADFSRPYGVYHLRTKSSEPFGLGLEGTVTALTRNITKAAAKTVAAVVPFV